MNNKKSYCVLKECFFNEPEREPYFEAVKKEFGSYEEAEVFVERTCHEEACDFNRNKTEGVLNFTSDESGDERYNFWTIAWDGEDYRIVTGYIIVEIGNTDEGRSRENAE